jgi:hypothetical protein
MVTGPTHAIGSNGFRCLEGHFETSRKLARSGIMNVAYQICRRCNQPMPSVAEINPFGGRPGLILFICDGCGTTDSSSIYPAKQDGNHATDHNFR